MLVPSKNRCPARWRGGTAFHKKTLGKDCIFIMIELQWKFILMNHFFFFLILVIGSQNSVTFLWVIQHWKTSEFWLIKHLIFCTVVLDYNSTAYIHTYTSINTHFIKWYTVIITITVPWYWQLNFCFIINTNYC